MKKNSVRWSDVSTYRGELFGLAIISVIVLHYLGSLTHDNTNRLVYTIAKIYSGTIGSVGVDIFAFLSGFGLYYSLSRRNDIVGFYKKRFQRVVFPYLVLGFFFWIIKDVFILKLSFTRVLYDYSLLSFWGEGVETFWYIAYICLMYILSPVIMRLTDSRAKLILVVLFTSSICVIYYLVSPENFDKIEIAMQRLPVFPIGMYCGRLSKKGKMITKEVILLLLLSVPIKIAVGVIDFPLARLFNGFYAIFIIVFYCLLRNNFNSTFFPTNSAINRFITLCGKYSLELYIVHMATRNMMLTLQFNMHNIFIYLLHLLIVVPVAMVFVRLQEIKLFSEL